MLRQLLASIRVNLTFYRRNRLLLVVAVLLSFMFIISLIPSLLFETSTQRFVVITTILEPLNFFFFLFAGALGLVAVSSHLRDRSIKMVATKPLPPELWLLSHVVSASVLFAGLAGCALILAGGLLLFWEIPFQTGLVYLSVLTVCRCSIVYGYLTFLTTLVHPAVAGLIVVVLQQDTFYHLSLLAASGQRIVESGLYQALLGSVKQVLYMCYLVLPIYTPFPEEVGRIEASYRLESGDVRFLLWSVAYTLALTALLYFLSIAALRRRRLI